VLTEEEEEEEERARKLELCFQSKYSEKALTF
jgi:hypothetical protein